MVVDVLDVSHEFSASQTDLVRALLELCGGACDRDWLIERAVELALASRADCIAVVEDLTRLGVLVPGSLLASEFHDLSSNPQRYADGLSAAEVLGLQATDATPRPGQPETALPEPSAHGLLALTAARHTSRAFESRLLGTSDLSQLLACGYGPQRPVASAGDLAPLSLTALLPRGAEGLESGVYRYDRDQHALSSVAALQESDRYLTEYALASASCLGEAPLIVLISADLGPEALKYGPRGYRYTVLEAGAIAQNMALAAEELGLGAFTYGGYRDAESAAIGQLEPAQRLILVMGIGYPMAGETESASDLAFELEYELMEPRGPVQMLRTSEPWPTDLATVLAVADFAEVASERTGRAGGIATTTAVARIRALAEAFERHCCGAARIDATACATDLPELWLDPRAVTPYSDEQLGGVPDLAAFDPDTPIEWVLGSAFDGSPTYVPADLVFYPFDATARGRRNIFYANSSGAAAHRTAEMALRAAVLELIERDCLGRMWLTQTPPRRVDTATLEGRAAAQIAYLTLFDYRTDLFDLSDHGAAVAMAVATSRSTMPAVAVGAAAHSTSWDAAAAKALDEAVNGAGEGDHRRLEVEDVRIGADHGDYYAYPDRLESLDFMYEHQPGARPANQPGPDLEELDVTTVSLTPTDRSSPLEVVRAFSPRLLPLWFGWGMEHHTHVSVAGRTSYPAPPHPLP